MESLRQNRRLGYKIGVSERHFYERGDMDVGSVLPDRSDHYVGRRLQEMDEFNWCSTSNSLNRDICTVVKSQQECGSCWAFAAVDAIETAAAIAEGKDPVPLSAQQLLDCSRNELKQVFTYCWAQEKDRGAPWLESTMAWSSKNNGCQGGMTHAAFQYIAIDSPGIAPQVEMPYTEGAGGVKVKECRKSTSSNAARIQNWNQAVGLNCAASSDPNELLKNALAIQPISVAVSSAYPFKDYKGGMYNCPNNGNFVRHELIDHALVLTGYGTHPTLGLYWILKNSYGTAWGDQGFMRILADDKINCGINIYPVRPLGANGVVAVDLDASGEFVLLSLKPSTWIAAGVMLSLATVVSIIAGAIVVHRAAKSQSSNTYQTLH